MAPVLEPVVVGFVTVCTCRIIASQKPRRESRHADED